MPTSTLLNNFTGWLWGLIMLISAAFKLTVDAAVISCILVFVLMAADFISGVLASMREGKKPTSRRFRWSLVKIFVYVGSMAFTAILGAILHALELAAGNSDGTFTVAALLYLVKIEAWVICWIEVVSILENINRIMPNNLYIKFLLWVVSVEFVKKIPKFADFLKQKTTKCNVENENKEH